MTQESVRLVVPLVCLVMCQEEAEVPLIEPAVLPRLTHGSQDLIRNRSLAFKKGLDLNGLKLAVAVTIHQVEEFASSAVHREGQGKWGHEGVKGCSST